MKRGFNKPSHSHTGLLLVLAAFLFISACQPVPQTPATPALVTVTVSILPQAYFVERIGGDMVAVNVMVGPGEEPHTYEPKPNQMKALENSPLFFSIGVEYEDTWIPRFKDVNPNMQIVDSSAGVQRIEMQTTDSHQSADLNQETDHTHNTDPHIWLAPDNAKIIAENILSALQNLLPNETETLQSRFDQLVADINELDSSIHETLSNANIRSFIVFHPAWGYFARQYDLQQIAVQVGGQDPSPSELADVVKLAKQNNIRVIFIQPTFSTASVDALSQEINAEIVTVDPLTKDWLTNLRTVANAFALAMKNQ